MKTARTWRFAHVWMAFSLLAMVVIPWAGVTQLVPGWSDIVQAVPVRGWLALITLGLFWGVASLLYGVAVDLLGIALGFAIQLGLSIVIGSLLPLLWSKALALRTARDALFFAGLALMVAGVIICAEAGGARSGTAGATGARFRIGLFIAILGGIGAPLLNFGIHYGTSLLTAAKQIAGVATCGLNAYVAWAVFLSAAAVTQVGFCLRRILKEQQAALFCQRGTGLDALGVATMSLVWTSSIFVYGTSVQGLGRLGISSGWPVFIALIIVTSNAWGVVLGEWKGAPGAVLRRMLLGSAMLILAVLLVGQARPTP